MNDNGYCKVVIDRYPDMDGMMYGWRTTVDGVELKNTTDIHLSICVDSVPKLTVTQIALPDDPIVIDQCQVEPVITPPVGWKIVATTIPGENPLHYTREYRLVVDPTFGAEQAVIDNAIGYLLQTAADPQVTRYWPKIREAVAAFSRALGR